MEMMMMNSNFQEILNHSSDVFIADFTELTKNTNNKRGVEISDNIFGEDIKSFKILNPNGISFNSVNLDSISNSDFFVDQNGDKRKSCECFCFSEKGQENKKAWILFLELKYCKVKNGISNSNKAILQLEETLKLFKEKDLIKNEDYNIYLVFSLPGNPKPPFNSFAVSPGELLKWKKDYNATLMGTNVIEVYSNSILKNVSI